jgi:hypothetical protein
MKSKIFLLGTFISVLVFMMFGCGSSPSTTTAINSGFSGLALDTAIEQAAERIENAFESGTEIALVSVSSPSTQFSEYVLTYLETILVNNGKLAVVDRSNLDRIREEQGFQMSGEVSDESAKAIGQLLGAGAIVTGGLVNLGDAYRLNLKAINVETARIGASYAGDIASSPRIQTLLVSGGGAASGGGIRSGTQTAQTGSTAAPASLPAPVYKVGDTGPAGGFIFYDKGTSAGGWRYLEAAPVETEKLAKFLGRTARDRTVAYGTGTPPFVVQAGIGVGKKNTETICSFLANNGEWDMAAQVCDELVVNGFDDWFLPSFNELSLMYGNLHRSGLGGFQRTYYWSSTIEVEGSVRVYPQHYYPVGMNFADASRDTYYADSTEVYVRAIRQF